jgi:hypothetical protein
LKGNFPSSVTEQLLRNKMPLLQGEREWKLLQSMFVKHQKGETKKEGEQQRSVASTAWSGGC